MADADGSLWVAVFVVNQLYKAVMDTPGLLRTFGILYAVFIAVLSVIVGIVLLRLYCLRQSRAALRPGREHDGDSRPASHSMFVPLASLNGQHQGQRHQHDNVQSQPSDPPPYRENNEAGTPHGGNKGLSPHTGQGHPHPSHPPPPYRENGHPGIRHEDGHQGVIPTAEPPRYPDTSAVDLPKTKKGKAPARPSPDDPAPRPCSPRQEHKADTGSDGSSSSSHANDKKRQRAGRNQVKTKKELAEELAKKSEHNDGRSDETRGQQAATAGPETGNGSSSSSSSHTEATHRPRDATAKEETGTQQRPRKPPLPTRQLPLTPPELEELDKKMEEEAEVYMEIVETDLYSPEELEERAHAGDGHENYEGVGASGTRQEVRSGEYENDYLPPDPSTSHHDYGNDYLPVTSDQAEQDDEDYLVPIPSPRVSSSSPYEVDE